MLKASTVRIRKILWTGVVELSTNARLYYDWSHCRWGKMAFNTVVLGTLPLKNTLCCMLLQAKCGNNWRPYRHTSVYTVVELVQKKDRCTDEGGMGCMMGMHIPLYYVSLARLFQTCRNPDIVHFCTGRYKSTYDKEETIPSKWKPLFFPLLSYGENGVFLPPRSPSFDTN